MESPTEQLSVPDISRMEIVYDQKVRVVFVMVCGWFWSKTERSPEK